MSASGVQISVTPPDPRAIEKARRKRIFWASLIASFASAAMFLYLLIVGIYCSSVTEAACFQHLHPWVAGAIASVAVFILAVVSSISHYDD